MDKFVVNLKKDLLEQFKDKPNIVALVEVIGSQLDDLYAFLEQIATERDISTAVGKQLDGIGDIVSLSRLESSRINNSYLSETNGTDDETYRKHLFYKVLKNTCNCTYDEIMSAINMFWEGNPIKYSEDPNYPATILFDFDAITDAAKKALALPFIKAGGVGLRMRMNAQDEGKVYYGMSLQRSINQFIGCYQPVIEPATYLADEEDNILTDEVDAWLCE